MAAAYPRPTRKAGARRAAAASLPRRRGHRVRMSFAALHESVVGTSRTSGDVRLESAKWGKADIDQVAVTNRDFMSTRPKPAHQPAPFYGLAAELFCSKYPATALGLNRNTISIASFRQREESGLGREPPP